MIEAEFVFGGFETVLDSPTMAFDQYQFFHGRVLGTPRGEVGEIAIAMLRRISRPRVHFPVSVLLYSPASDRPVQDRPSHAARAFGSIACRQASPCAFGKIFAIFAALPRTICFLPQEWNR